MWQVASIVKAWNFWSFQMLCSQGTRPKCLTCLHTSCIVMLPWAFNKYVVNTDGEPYLKQTSNNNQWWVGWWWKGWIQLHKAHHQLALGTRFCKPPALVRWAFWCFPMDSLLLLLNKGHKGKLGIPPLWHFEGHVLCGFSQKLETSAPPPEKCLERKCEKMLAQVSFNGHANIKVYV